MIIRLEIVVSRRSEESGPRTRLWASRVAQSAKRRAKNLEIEEFRDSGIADLEFGLWEQDLTLDVYTVAYLSLAVLSGILALKHYSSNDQ